MLTSGTEIIKFIDQKVAGLRTIKETILAHCEIARPILPNDLPELAVACHQRHVQFIKCSDHTVRLSSLRRMSKSSRWPPKPRATDCLLTRGVPKGKVVDRILAATRKSVGDDP